MKKICFVTAIPMTVEAFLVDYIYELSKVYDVTVVTNTYDRGFLECYRLNCKVIPVPIERKISLVKDMTAFLKLFSIFRTERFNSVHSVTPKAGLLSMGASFLARIPIRIHTFTGQVWATKKGIKRLLLKNIDRVTAFFATHILVDSYSQREFIIKEKIVASEKADIIGSGSICGVDMRRYSFDSNIREEMREKLGIKRHDFVFIFIGRLNREKGVLDLIKAFSIISQKCKDVHLVIVGPDEERIKDKIVKMGQHTGKRIHFEGPTREPEKYLCASDCLCLPSYREGFGLVIIEAASIGIPAIGSRIYGITDAIEEGVTGLLHTPGNVEELAIQMEWMIENKSERKLMGERARKRAYELFSKQRMVEGFTRFYSEVIGV
ncbi:MAG: glycosyltransferase family 4 protein [Syntrophorhabdaceae bacterium]|nr:glycosyltransferase family 4 protein [Syntrophorhabdaceae bacterium]